MSELSFDPTQHLIKVQGGADYLPVYARLLWFRQAHPEWGIRTHMDAYDEEAGTVVVSAVIMDDQGRTVSSGIKRETRKDFKDFPEKAETGAIGRALGALGFGTAFALDEFDTGTMRLADSPLSSQSRPKPETKAEMIERLYTLGKVKGKTENDVDNGAQKVFGKALNDCTNEEITRLITKMASL